MNEMGYPADWIERQLAHTETNAVRRTYNHADYLTDRAKMMQQWADTLDSWRDGAALLSLRSAQCEGYSPIKPRLTPTGRIPRALDAS